MIDDLMQNYLNRRRELLDVIELWRSATCVFSGTALEPLARDTHGMLVKVADVVDGLVLQVMPPGTRQ